MDVRDSKVTLIGATNSKSLTSLVRHEVQHILHELSLENQFVKKEDVSMLIGQCIQDQAYAFRDIMAQKYKQSTKTNNKSEKVSFNVTLDKNRGEENSDLVSRNFEVLETRVKRLERRFTKLFATLAALREWRERVARVAKCECGKFKYLTKKDKPFKNLYTTKEEDPLQYNKHKGYTPRHSHDPTKTEASQTFVEKKEISTQTSGNIKLTYEDNKSIEFPQASPENKQGEHLEIQHGKYIKIPKTSFKINGEFPRTFRNGELAKYLRQPNDSVLIKLYKASLEKKAERSSNPSDDVMMKTPQLFAKRPEILVYANNDIPTFVSDANPFKSVNNRWERCLIPAEETKKLVTETPNTRLATKPANYKVNSKITGPKRSARALLESAEYYREHRLYAQNLFTYKKSSVTLQLNNQTSYDYIGDLQKPYRYKRRN